MSFIKYYEHGASVYIEPHYMQGEQLAEYLKELRQIAKEELEKSDADHCVYAVKRYAENEEIDHMDFYIPPVCLSDAAFYERTAAVEKEGPCIIYALHRGTIEEKDVSYTFRCTFRGKPACGMCMLCFQKLGWNGESQNHCCALGSRPSCPEERARNDCPLVAVDEKEDK